MADRFDDMCRGLASPISRRRAFWVIAGAVAGGGARALARPGEGRRAVWTFHGRA